jgi:hypothetical protein
MIPPHNAVGYRINVTRAALWASEHGELLDRIVLQLLETGHWPRVSDLERSMFQDGAAGDPRQDLLNLPESLGQIEQDHVALTVRGLSYSPSAAAAPLLAQFTAVM